MVESVDIDEACGADSGYAYDLAAEEGAGVGTMAGGGTECVRHQGEYASEGAPVARNFRQLLWFWRQYYTHRGCDCRSLAFSSGIDFEEWHRMVELLCAAGGGSTALLPASDAEGLLEELKELSAKSRAP